MSKRGDGVPHNLELTRCSHQFIESGKESQPILEFSHSLAEVREEKRTKLDPWFTRCSHQDTEIGKGSQPSLESGKTTLEEIPEDSILCSILSMLKMKEAVRTSILSRRWRNLWTYITNIKFDSYNMLENGLVPDDYWTYWFSCLSFADKKAVLSRRRDKFIRTVNEFLHHHRGHGVNEFIIEFCLTKEHAHHLDKWVEFAIGSGAKELRVLLEEVIGSFSNPTERYDFPFCLFDDGRGSSIETLHISYCSLSPHATFTGFKFLKSLSLSHVYMTDMKMRLLLSYCFVIESLSLKFCKGLVNLDIFHQSGRLKSFIIFDCPGVLKIELDSVVLTVLEYLGNWPMIHLKNASRIVNATINFDIPSLRTSLFLPKLSIDIPQLEGLSLDCYDPIVVGITPKSYKFSLLKKLFLGIKRIEKLDVFMLALTLNSAPLLEEFHVDIYGSGEEPLWHHWVGRLGLCIPDVTHMKLRRFKLGGFDGWEDEVELVSYVMRNAIALELVSFDRTPHRYSFVDGWNVQFNIPGPFSFGRTRIQAFRKLEKMPRSPGVKLVFDH